MILRSIIAIVSLRLTIFFTSSLENDNLHGGPVINTDNYVAIYGKTFLHKSYDVSQGVLTAKQVLEV